MEIKEYISRMKLFYHSFLEFIDNDIDTPDSFQQIITFIKENRFGENPDELRSILHIIYKIASQRKRNSTSMSKAEKTILYYETKIKQTFTNFEIYQIFKKDKFLLLFLFKHQIITIDEQITTHLLENHGRFYSNFFYPEMKPFLEELEQNGQSKFLSIFEVSSPYFDEKRQKGENDSEVCQLIRQDSLDEFISIYKDQQLNATSSIPRSIYETNIYLCKNGIILIQYAAFFGSIKIIRYLLDNLIEKVSLSSLWNFSIRSGNIELIRLLEEKKIDESSYLYEKCFLDAVKCHYNYIAHYIKNNLFEKNENKFIEECFSYYNFEFFLDDFNDNYDLIFQYACHYDYVIIVKILLNDKKIDVKHEIKIFFVILFINEIYNQINFK